MEEYHNSDVLSKEYTSKINHSGNKKRKFLLIDPTGLSNLIGTEKCVGYNTGK
jgi:hypothetical protein